MFFGILTLLDIVAFKSFFVEKIKLAIDTYI